MVLRGIELHSGIKIEADIVISNADLHFTETKLLSPTVRSYPAQYWDKKEAGISGLLVYLGIRGQLPQLQHHNLFFVDAWKRISIRYFAPKRYPTQPLCISLSVKN